MNNFQLALKQLDEEWFASLPSFEDAPPVEVSKQFLQWEQRVIYGKKSTANKVVKVILIAAALLIVFSVIALSTTKGREFIMQFFKESAVYSLQAEQSRFVNKIEVKYIPEGFELDDVFEDKTLLYYHYTMNNKRIEIQKRIIETTADFIYKDKTYETIDKEGLTYIISLEDNGYCNVVWNKNGYFYQVCGSISKDEALKVAFGVD